MALSLRYYQQEALEKMYQFETAKLHKEALVIMATGTGKTEVFLNYIAKKAQTAPNARILILERNKGLVTQTAERLCNSFPMLSYQVGLEGYLPETCREKMPIVTISMAQTMRPYIDRRIISKDAFDIIIIDECHHENISSAELAIICNYFNYQYCYGFTATPKTGQLFTSDTIIFHYPILQAQRDGYLISDIKYYNVDVISNPNNESIVNFTEAVNKICLEEQARHCLWYCSNINAAELLRCTMEHRGVECCVICGDTPMDVRQEYIDRFKQDPYFNIININVFNEGMDVPEIETIVIAKQIASDHLAKQVLGRGLRKCKGKTSLRIYDLCVNQNIYSKLYKDILLSPFEVVLNNPKFKERNYYSTTKIEQIVEILRSMPEEMLDTFQSKLHLFEFKESFLIPELSKFRIVYEGNIGYLYGKNEYNSSQFCFAIENLNDKYILYSNYPALSKDFTDPSSLSEYLSCVIKKYDLLYMTYTDTKGVHRGANTPPTEDQMKLLCKTRNIDYNIAKPYLMTLYTKYSLGIELTEICAPEICKRMLKDILPTKSQVNSITTPTNTPSTTKQTNDKNTTTPTGVSLKTTKVTSKSKKVNNQTIITPLREKTENKKFIRYVQPGCLAIAAASVKGRSNKIEKAIKDHTLYCGSYWEYTTEENI